jgi:hypothetical protein
MTASKLPLKLRFALWARSVVLPDLSRWVSLDRLLRSYEPRRVSADWARYSAAEILAVVDRHLSGCRRMRGRRCLRRGLLAYYFLRLAGHPAVLHFGVFPRPQGRALAHCWTSVGALVDDPPSEECVEMSQWRGSQAYSSPFQGEVGRG